MKKSSPTDAKLRFQEWLLQRHKDDLVKVTAVLNSMVTPYSEIVIETKRPLIPKAFKEYLEMLSPLGLYTSYKEEKNGYRVYHSTK